MESMSWLKAKTNFHKFTRIAGDKCTQNGLTSNQRGIDDDGRELALMFTLQPII